MTSPSRPSDPERAAHQAWLGLLQPQGLVVVPPALVRAQAVLDRNVAPLQQTLLGIVTHPPTAAPVLHDFPRFAVAVLGFAPEDLAGAPGGPPLPEHLAVALPDHGETLRPTYAILDPYAASEAPAVLLVQTMDSGTDLDAPPRAAATVGFAASPAARFERLLRDTGVPVGLLTNGHELRLVYAPRGESTGHIGFPIAEMCTVGGRPILAALHMLLCEHRVLTAPAGQRLGDLLAESRHYQNEVSTRLADQVQGALWELLCGFQAADAHAAGRLLADLGRSDPNHLYGGLLTVIMRLVFLLYAEDQGLMPDHPVYAQNYSVGGLYERLREDAFRTPDTLDQRYGAWAALLTTFRLVFDGGGHGTLRLPARHGQLFNPDDYPFLEGRPRHVLRVMGERFEAPRVSDGVVFRVLEGLLLLDGERLSYRALDVEQVGSVYESMMGFDVRATPGRAVALRPNHVVIDLDALLAAPGPTRAAWLKAEAECELPASAATALAAATTVDDLTAALGRRLSPRTPQPLPPGALFLQPGEERRRSGSHYTPRALTEPIVRTTLGPVLLALGAHPTPDQILDLKVCDPAMGSGAFLVETCRQLAHALTAAWAHHGGRPVVAPDEDPLLVARRLVAQRCLYGVDKNPFAVNLAKLSLWLVTLARDHAFTFLDHALKHGDSLVGLTRQQISLFHWVPQAQSDDVFGAVVTAGVATAAAHRRAIMATSNPDYDHQAAAHRDAEYALETPRRVGDLCVAAFFGADKDKDREALRRAYRHQSETGLGDDRALGALRRIVAELGEGERPLVPLHWELEFPEVFSRENPGFDAIVGNPPFAGKNTTLHGSREGFLDWLKACHPDSHGNADLVAHFFRRAFDLVRHGGTFGLIATNTIGQGDTRATGLRYVCTHGGTIFAATRRVKWPGLAAVVVSVVHVVRGPWAGTCVLDGRPVPRITAFLFHGGGHDNPHTLAANAGQSFQGSIVLGMGFTFDDTDTSGTAAPLAEMERLITRDPCNAERIFPYIGGQEVNTSPTHAHHRYVIHFGEMSEAEARRWPDLMAMVEARVKPERMKLGTNADAQRRKANWWLWGRYTPALFHAIAGLDRVLAIARVGQHGAFTFLPAGLVYSEGLVVFPLATHAALCALQSRPHEVWARFFGSSMKDDLRYTPSDCFETFPFPPDWQTSPTLEAAGQAYDDHRRALMVANDEGLTKTYNRFHDPDERAPTILKLRALHEAMDRAVLDAYGWGDIATDCVFALDYAIDEESFGAKKKPWRYRFPDPVQDEVLARLLDLNQKRYEEEVAAGTTAKGDTKAPVRRARPKTAPAPAAAALPLFDLMAKRGDDPC